MRSVRTPHAVVSITLWAGAMLGVGHASQAQRPDTRFITGDRDLVTLDFAGTAIGDFPGTIKMVDGVMDVVTINGTHMLRAAARSAFLIQLPEVLPKNFAVEVDLIPKVGEAADDLTIEGTPQINQGRNSAHVLWHSQRIAVIGGANDNYETRLPDAISVATAGRLTKVVFQVDDQLIKVFTNGRLLATLPDRRFVRGRVLRVSLGGEDDGTRAVYLASLKVIAKGPPAGPIVAGDSPVRGPDPTQPDIGAPPLPDTQVPPRSRESSTSVKNASTQTQSTSSTPTVGSPSPATTGGVPNAMNDGEAPTVAVQSTPGGIEVKYTTVPGAQQYIVCRESPPGSTCQPVNLGEVAVTAGGNVNVAYDLGLPLESAHTYRVRAVLSNGHYGEGGPVTSMVGPIPPPTNLRVTRVTTTHATLEWDAVQYVDYDGVKTLTTYELSGTGILEPTRVNSTLVTVPLSAANGHYDWKIAPVLVGRSGSVHRSPPAVLSYVCQYRIVAIGLFVGGHTNESALNFDGAEDEAYVAMVVGLTNKMIQSPVVTTRKSSTFGDVAGFAGRIKAGSASPNGGLQPGDRIPTRIDVNAPAGAPAPGFPLLVWEGQLDDESVLVVHPAVWEEDRSNRSYLQWLEHTSNLVKSGYAGQAPTLQRIHQLVDYGEFGPTRPMTYTPCTTRSTSIIQGASQACVDGEDRPLGLYPQSSAEYLAYDNRFLVFGRKAIEKSLHLPASQQPILGVSGFNASAPGVIAIEFRDESTIQPPMGSGDYILYLKVERVP